MSNKITLYHGGYQEIREPDLNRGREDIDFGVGFYLTPDIEMAKRYAYNWGIPVVSVYEVDLDALTKYEFSLNEEWLDYIKQNYHFKDSLVDKYDILIGPSADNTIFCESMLYDYFSIDKVSEFFNSVGYPVQYVLKTPTATKHCHFVESFTLTEEEKTKCHELFLEELHRSYETKKLCEKE